MLEIQRTLATELKGHVEKPEITILIGPRQAGKTTLLKEISANLSAEGKKVLFYNLDIEKDRHFFAGQEVFVERIRSLTGGEKHYIFIDEIQRLENAGLFLKGLYDRGWNHKLIVTGSGSLELKEKIAESLVGRKRNFYLYTVSLGEYARYRTDYTYAARLPDVLHTDPTLAESILANYLRFGGYPKVVTEPTENEKYRTLDEIYQGYIERDIKAILQLEKTSAFVTLLQVMANRSGHTVNYSDLSSFTALSTATVKNYLWYSEKTFITQSITPYFTNKEKEIVKAPTFYYLDNGMRNYLRGIFDDPIDRGMRFQTLVFRLLEEQFRGSVASIHFWQTKARAEVDFVVNRGYDLLPVEVKATNLTKPKVTRAYRSFLQAYQPNEGWIVNRSFRTTITIGSTTVKFIPWYDLM
jgi:predicted AAA+ superfamily ATPase